MLYKMVTASVLSNERRREAIAVSRILSADAPRNADWMIISLRSPKRPAAEAVRLIPEGFHPEVKRAGGPSFCSVLHHAGFIMPPRLLSGR